MKRMLFLVNELMEWASRSSTAQVQPKLLKPSSINQQGCFLANKIIMSSFALLLSFEFKLHAHTHLIYNFLKKAYIKDAT